MKIIFIQLFGFLFLATSPSFIVAQDTLIQAGAEWKYYDAGNAPSGNWTNISYNDTSWASGFAQLGYGDSDETTLTDDDARTTYFRKSFMVTNPTQYQSMLLKLLRDDGAVVYINGTEIWRDNMPSGSVSYGTFSSSAVSGSEEDRWFNQLIINTLVVGMNIVAVEVHQQIFSLFNSDISFDFQFLADTIKQDSIIRGPYLQNGTSNSMVVRWRTSAFSESILKYSTDINNITTVIQDSVKKRNHEVLITGLQPATRYYYTIYSSSDTLSPADSSNYFQTNPIPGQAVPTTIWALGDCGSANNNQRAVRDAYYSYIGHDHTDIMLFLGDNAYQDGTDSEYQNAVFENMYEAMLSKTVAWSTIGNHDAHSASPSNQSGPYFDIFSFPKQGEAGGIPSGTEAYYSFDYGNIHFIVLNSESLGGLGTGSSMYSWCQNDIQNTNADWIIGIWHHPPYTKGSHDSDFEPQLFQMRNNFLPMLEANGVDLVLCGHSHSYERSYFLNGHTGLAFSFDAAQHVVGANGGGDGKIGSDGAYLKETVGPNTGKGAVYITAGSSGKISGGDLDHPAMFSSLNQLGSCVVEVQNNQLDMKFVRENGQIDDYFTIIKNMPTNAVNSISKGDRPTLEVYPNPSSDIINISTKAKLKFVQIFDNKGTEIKFINGHPNTVNVEDLPDGLYIVAGTTAGGQHLFQKLVVGE
jgi:hypothetical protein